MIRGSHAVASLLCVTMISALVACAGGSGQGGSGAADATAEANRAALAPIAMPTVAETKPRDYPGIHNAVAYHPGFISGSQPEGDKGDKNAGFKTLAAMGIRTIITVDGAEPNVEEAKKYGMKYIHLPIGYNGFDEERELQLTRATRDAMKDGPVYIHCHHGKHRSAGAAATIATNLGWETAEQGIARMKVSGTAANYTGLFACAAEARPIDKATLDAVDADFPERWKPSGFVAGMNDIDHVFEHLKEIAAAGWVAPKDHPDLVPVAEAGRLADLYRVLHGDEYVAKRGGGLGEAMMEANARAQKLEDLLGGSEKTPDKKKLGDQFKLVSASCKDCHAKYRDVR